MKKEIDFELRKRALELEQARHEQLTSAMNGLPTRKTGEVSALCRAAQTLHKLLTIYDVMPGDQPAMAGISQTAFDAAIARIEEARDELNKTIDQ